MKWTLIILVISAVCSIWAPGLTLSVPLGSFGWLIPLRIQKRWTSEWNYWLTSQIHISWSWAHLIFEFLSSVNIITVETTVKRHLAGGKKVTHIVEDLLELFLAEIFRFDSYRTICGRFGYNAQNTIPERVIAIN